MSQHSKSYLAIICRGLQHLALGCARARCFALSIILFALTTDSSLAQYTARPANPAEITSAPLRFAGLSLTTVSATGVIGCSGAVVYDPKLMLSASHCSFDIKDSINPWRPAPEFFSRWHSSSLPTLGSGALTRGYLYFTSYAGDVFSKGMNDWASFDNDFTANFSYAPLNEEVAPSTTNGTFRLLSKGTRLTVGYPSGLYRSGAPEKFLMHYSGPWDSDCLLTTGSAVYCNGVSAGPGNSGGPVFVWEPSISSYVFAGVHVAGNVRKLGDPIDSSGINTIDAPEWNLVQQAIIAADPNQATRGTQNAPRNPKIQLLGNKAPIAAGSIEPFRSNHTDFGSVTSSKEVQRSFSLINSGEISLNLKEHRPIRISGAGARHFTLNKQPKRQIAPNDSEQFSITFKRSPRGTFLANVTISSDDPSQPTYSFRIKARRR